MFRQKPDKEKNYLFLANIMKEGKVTSTEKALGHIRGLKMRSTQFSAIALAVGMILFLIIPKLVVFWFMMAMGAIAWAWASTFSTIALIKLYIERELQKTEQNP